MSTGTEQLAQTFIGDVLVWDGLRDELKARHFVGQRDDGSWTWTAEGHRWLVRMLAAAVHVGVPRSF